MLRPNRWQMAGLVVAGVIGLAAWPLSAQEPGLSGARVRTYDPSRRVPPLPTVCMPTLRSNHCVSNIASSPHAIAPQSLM